MKLLKHLVVITLICYGQSMLAMDGLRLRKHGQSAPEIPPITEMNNKLIHLMAIKMITNTPLTRNYKNISSDEEFVRIWAMEYATILPRDIDARLSDSECYIPDTDDAIEIGIIAPMAYELSLLTTYTLRRKIESLFFRIFPNQSTLPRTPESVCNLINANISQDYLDYLIGCYFEYREMPYYVDMSADQYFGPYADYYLAKRAEYLRKKDGKNPGLRKGH